MLLIWKFMFSSCYKLKEINGINNFNTIKVNDMYSMFTCCNELKNIDLSNFNTSNVTDMSYMFSSCKKLKEIKGINNFNTINVTNMSSMFEECEEMECLDLSNFNTSNVTNLEKMFKRCYKLKEIKGINNFDISKIKDKETMFEDCKELSNSVPSYFNISSDINNKKQSKDDSDKEKNENLENIDGSNSQEQMLDNSEKKFVLLFRSSNQTINYSIKCGKSDIFSEVEEKLYYEFPELKKKNINFILNGNIINRTSSLEENGIHNDNIVLIEYN